MQRCHPGLLLLGMAACTNHTQRTSAPQHFIVVDVESGRLVMDVGATAQGKVFRSDEVTFSWSEETLQNYCAVAVGGLNPVRWWISSDCRFARTRDGNVCFPEQEVPPWGSRDGGSLRVSGCVRENTEREGAWWCGTYWQEEADTVQQVLYKCSLEREQMPCSALRPQAQLQAQCEEILEPNETVPDGGWWALDHRVEVRISRWDRRFRGFDIDGGHRVCWEAANCEPAEVRYRWSKCWFVDDHDDGGRALRTGHCERWGDRSVLSDGCEDPFAAELEIRRREVPLRSHPTDGGDDGGTIWKRSTITYFVD